MTTRSSPSSRVHVVLVPGFAGFDALGQLEYYAGVTPAFRAWAAGEASTARVELHYFDNLPTASVATRAARLRQYLAKRYARGELQPGDALALVGHSTGGLDIRRLLLDLDEQARAGVAIEVDGARGTAFTVRPGDLLAMVRGLVFLSVPQRGTNIADWVGAHPHARCRAVDALRGAVNAARLPQLDELQAWFAGRAASFARADLFLAVRDALAEIDATGDDPARRAAAQEAAAELELWLRHIASDFSAIDDLAAAPAASRASPAHASDEQREEERRMWARRGIRTRSYATLGTRPYDFPEGDAVPAWEILKPLTFPFMRLAAGVSARVDPVYLCAYRACAGGPFRAPLAPSVLEATELGGTARRKIEIWDNDGIVNTASMLWPDGPETRLVAGDHGDIIGHYRLVEAIEGAARRYHTYDLLRSGSGFDEAAFRAVWRDVFAFCAESAG